MSRFRQVSGREVLVSLLVASLAFILMGTLTGLWDNPFFLRMTSLEILDYLILAAESLLIGFLIGIKKGECSTGPAAAGGIFAFLGFACPICNKLLIYLFGATFLLSYLEPVRQWIGLLGILILLHLLYKKLLTTPG